MQSRERSKNSIKVIPLAFA